VEQAPGVEPHGDLPLFLGDRPDRVVPPISPPEPVTTAI
jgi:hypothetical protein